MPLTPFVILNHSDFNFPGQKGLYRGKVRDVYNIEDKYLVMIATDRVSAFDIVLTQGIPYKGQVLNQITDRFLDAGEKVVPIWKIRTPDPNVIIGHKVQPFPVEMVVRGYLTGHAWREYRDGKRTLCGEYLPEGMKQHKKFERPIITPTTKAHEGHDEDVSKEEIIERGLVSKEDYEQLEEYSLRLFVQGTQMAQDKGLILVDTKYEFGKKDDGEIVLIDEVHTPDSSRYFYADDYRKRFEKGKSPKQLSKEFVRDWLIKKGFQGDEKEIPEMSGKFIRKVSKRYIELFEMLTGEKFQFPHGGDIEKRIKRNVEDTLD